MDKSALASVSQTIKADIFETMRSWPVVLLLVLFFFEAKAQSDGEINSQYWFDIMPHFRISDAFEFYGDASYRTMNEGERQILSVRPSLRYQAGPRISFHIGLGLFYNWHTGGLGEIPDYLEIRPFEGVRVGWPDIWRFNFKHYFRLEQRIFNYTDDTNDDFLHRGRYQIKTKFPINKKAVQEKTIYIPLAYELLGTSDEAVEVVFASQYRITVGLAYAINSDWILEFEYMRWWNRITPSYPLENTDQVFRFKIHRDGWLLGE